MATTKPDTTINERVARACGFQVREPILTNYLGVPQIWVQNARGGCMQFDPQNRANHAVLAAERFGLKATIIWNSGLRAWTAYDFARDCVISGGTFCETICSAILRLAEAGDDETQGNQKT